MEILNNFVDNYYFLIIAITIFLVFALIGVISENKRLKKEAAMVVQAGSTDNYEKAVETPLTKNAQISAIHPAGQPMPGNFNQVNQSPIQTQQVAEVTPQPVPQQVVAQPQVQVPTAAPVSAVQVPVQPAPVPTVDASLEGQILQNAVGTTEQASTVIQSNIGMQ